MITTMAETFGEKLKRLRLAKGLSQERLAALSGVQRSYITLLELRRAKGRISMQTAVGLAKALGIEPQLFFQDAEARIPAKSFNEIMAEAHHKYEALQLMEIPVKGAIPAGTPFPEEEAGEGFIEVPQGQLGAAAGKTGLYALRVSGSSLSGDGIADGDIVVIEPEPDFINDRIYAVRLGNEVLARHVHWLKGRVKLTASSGDYRELEAGEVEILGRIILSGRWKKH